MEAFILSEIYIDFQLMEKNSVVDVKSSNVSAIKYFIYRYINIYKLDMSHKIWQNIKNKTFISLLELYFGFFPKYNWKRNVRIIWNSEFFSLNFSLLWK